MGFRVGVYLVLILEVTPEEEVRLELVRKLRENVAARELDPQPWVLQRCAGQELGVRVEAHYILSRHKTWKVSKVVYGVETKPELPCFP